LWLQTGQRVATSHTHTHFLARSEEHTSELQSHLNLVCRLLLEKKTQATPEPHTHIAHTSSTTNHTQLQPQLSRHTEPSADQTHTNTRPYRHLHIFFFNDTPPPKIYPLPLHAALPI